MARKCKACNKKKHSTQDAAIAAALRNSARFGGSNRVYECPHGNGWHLTTQRDGKRAA